MHKEIDTDEYPEDEAPKLPEIIKSFFYKNRVIISVLLFIIVIIFSVLYYFTIYPRQQQKKINTVNLQKECDIQSLSIFNSITKNITNINYTYKNHYISSLSRCYILIHGVGVAETGLSDLLIDAFENKIIADCESFTSAPETNFCSYNDSAKVKYDIDQFNNFIKSSMETD
jgi:hypothetical protein